MNLRDLTKKYGRNKGLNVTAVGMYAAQLLVALRHLRKNGVLHADIKPDNILVNARRTKVRCFYPPETVWPAVTQSTELKAMWCNRPGGRRHGQLQDSCGSSPQMPVQYGDGVRPDSRAACLASTNEAHIAAERNCWRCGQDRSVTRSRPTEWLSAVRVCVPAGGLAGEAV
jgi:serine/threonine protein kinase